MRVYLTGLFFLMFFKSSFSAENRLIRIDFPDTNRDQSGVIHSICQDYLGYIWIGQSNGLYRFNGYDFKKIPTISESQYGISNNNISCIFEDSDSLLWIGTKGGGLNLYNRKTDSFQFFTSDSSKEISNLFNDISSIYEDQYKVLWIGTDGGGLNRLDKKDFSFTQIIDPENKTGSRVEKILSVYRGSPGEIYIGTWENGLKKIDLKTGKWEQMFPDLKGFPLNSRRNIWSITEVGSGKLLLGTFGEGALLFDKNTHQVNPLKAVKGKKVFCCCKDTDGSMYMGTELGLEKVKNDVGEIQGSPDEIRTITFDRDGHLWVGQQQNLWALKKIPAFFETPEVASRVGCATLFLDNQSFLWLSFPGKLVQLNLKDHSSKDFVFPEKISVNMISNWSAEKLVLATSEGVLFFDKQKGRLAQLPAQSPGFQEFVKGNAFFCALTPDSSKWISTLGTLYYQGGEEAKFISEKLLSSFSMSHYVSSVILDSDGSIWLGTFGGGLNHLNRKLNQVKVFKQTFVSKGGLSNNFIECMVRDRSHHLWIGTHDGLNLMTDSALGKFISFTIKDGLPNNEINSMVTDKDGILWLGTSKGLCRLNVEKMEFRIFGIEDGLPSIQFLKHSAYCQKNGNIVMGTAKGAILFNPQDIPGQRIAAKVFLESIQLFNEEIHPALNTVLEKNPLFTNTIRLNYDQNYFGVSFTSLPFFRKENTSYSYQLFGVDQNWQLTRSNSINYTNLLPGKYLLKIKSIIGTYTSDQRTLEIVILPPWWKSMPAYWIYTAMILLILFISIYLIVRRERRKGSLRLQKYTERKDQEMTELKFAFFSQVSAELKNPLTLLMNPLNELSELVKISHPGWNNQLTVMQSGAFQMKQILEQLVDFKKIGTGEHEPNLSVGNVSALLNRICLNYAARAKKGGQIFLFRISPEELFARFDAGLVTKIQGNVLDFFFSRSQENSKIYFESTVIPFDEKPLLSFFVSDHMGSLTPQQLQLLLQPFSGAHSDSLYGFGLAITTELVKICHGNIRVLNFETGLKIEIQLPLILTTAKTSKGSTNKETVGNKPVLLLVVGHTELRAYLAESFNSEYQVFECDYAEKAIKIMEEKMPDLIICDNELNAMDGLQFYMQIIENPKTDSIPFILLSDDTDQAIKLKALHTGVLSFIVKPFNVEEVQSFVRNYFSTRKTLKKELTSDSQSIQLRNVEINNTQKELLDRLLAFMEKNYSDSGLSVELLCTELDMSRPQIYRKLQTLTGLSVQEFIKSFRLKKAAAFLRTGEQRISDVAYRTGFSDPQHFSKSFKSQFGVSPSQYVAQHKT
jgi:ligand-binding sensor domain-containing protein/AraC-like DNA-binding protein/signal transduction histidine kinase